METPACSTTSRDCERRKFKGDLPRSIFYERSSIRTIAALSEISPRSRPKSQDPSSSLGPFPPRMEKSCLALRLCVCKKTPFIDALKVSIRSAFLRSALTLPWLFRKIDFSRTPYGVSEILSSRQPLQRKTTQLHAQSVP